MTHFSAPEGPTAGTLEPLERRVMLELVAGLAPAERAELGLDVHDLPGGSLLTLTRYPQVLDFNRTLDLGVTQAATEDTVEQLRALARSCGLPKILVGLAPGARPEDLRARLLALGAQPARAWMQLWRPAEVLPAPSAGVEVRSITPDEAGLFGEILLRGFGMPPDLDPLTRAVRGRPGWTEYVAWVDGEAVACGSLFVLGGYGWLGNATTLPQWRRHGAQAALIARRISDAARAGAHTVFTQVAEDLPDRPNPSEHNMRRAGFDTAYRRDHVVLPSGLED